MPSPVDRTGAIFHSCTDSQNRVLDHPCMQPVGFAATFSRLSVLRPCPEQGAQESAWEVSSDD